jgi:hypothetical protein
MFHCCVNANSNLKCVEFNGKWMEKIRAQKSFENWIGFLGQWETKLNQLQNPLLGCAIHCKFWEKLNAI